MSGEPVIEPSSGWLEHTVEQELPGLRVLSVEASVARPGRLDGDSPKDVEARMRDLSSRFRGGRAITLRREPIPAAYRVCFRQIGLDPDTERTPIEAAVLERMLRGGFPTGGLLDDVLLIALLDTGVPVWALDAELVDGPLGVRTSGEGEQLGSGERARALAGGRLVVADAARALALLFEAPAASHAPAPRARRLLLFAVQVAGVPTLYVEEALWSARTALEQG